MFVRFGLLCCLAFLFLLCGCGGAEMSRKEGVFFPGVALDGYPITGERLAQVSGEIPFTPQIVVFFLQWPGPGAPWEFPGESLEAIWASGAVPCITWEPMYYDQGKEIMISHQRLIGGQYDPYIRHFALGCKSLGRPLILRFAHEMNLERYHWGTSKEDYGPESPAIYQHMYRHVAQLFREVGASNVAWAFCPNAESVPHISYDPSAAWNTASAYYPGDEYVDILGMDGYNWGTTQRQETHGWDSHWKSFQEIFFPLYEELKALAPDKPLFVFETASADQGGHKGEWIRQAWETIAQWDVQALVWFQANKEIDWRLDATGAMAPARELPSKGISAQEWFKAHLAPQ